jgi:hypothetical protein
MFFSVDPDDNSTTSSASYHIKDSKTHYIKASLIDATDNEEHLMAIMSREIFALD